MNLQYTVIQEQKMIKESENMGLRNKIKSKIKKVLENFSGEFSQAAPQERTPYEKGVKDDNVEVVMAIPMHVEWPGPARCSAPPLRTRAQNRGFTCQETP